MFGKDFSDEYKTLDSTSVSGKKNLEKWDVYAEKKYSHKIKVTNWWYHREAYPKDCDDGVEAAYKRWGTYNDKSVWMTETMQRMKEGLGDPELHDFKERAKHINMLNFLSFPETLKTRKDLLPDEIKKILPELPRDLLTLRYTTTNQAHYKKDTSDVLCVPANGQCFGGTWKALPGETVLSVYRIRLKMGLQNRTTPQQPPHGPQHWQQ